jgi:putative transposase
LGLAAEGLEKPPEQAEEIMLHSDHGSQFTSLPHRKIAEQKNIMPPMPRAGNCCGNVAEESFSDASKKNFTYIKTLRRKKNYI